MGGIMRNKFLTLFLLLFTCILLYFLISPGNKSIFSKKDSTTVADTTLFTTAPVLNPKKALTTFKLAEGFKIELVASEPLIQSPVAMTFDEKGRIWVVEMQGYMPNIEGENEDQETGRIVILEDKDSDGRMDISKVFLDSLVLPRAIAIVKNGILYAEPPNLWFVENINDRSGKKILIDSAYAVGGNPEHQPNGLMRGIDNWYYNAKSDKRYKFRNGQWIKEETEFRGQWGITKDNYGRLFYNTNSNQLRGDLVPPNMLSRNSNFSAGLGINKEIVNNQNVYPVRPTTGINRGYQEHMLNEEGKLRNFTAACGPVIYRGDKFPEEFAGNAFVCEPAANLIKRNVLVESGTSVEGRQAYENYEFLASTDERFRPVNLYNAPDGNLYVLDMYKGIIQHKTYLTDYLREEINSRDLHKQLNYGRIYRIIYERDFLSSLLDKFKSNQQVPLDKASDEKLVSLLSHPNGWWRDNAQRILIERNDKTIVPEIINLLKHGDPWGQIHALWTLEGMNVYGPEVIEAGIKAKEPKVIATALRVGERNKKAAAAKEVLDLYEIVLENNNPLVRLQLALSVGEFMEGDPARVMNMLKSISLTEEKNQLINEAVMSSLQDKEKDFLSLLYEEPQPDRTKINFLEDVIRKISLRDQLEGKELTKAGKEQFLEGATLYSMNCAGCHHENGKGIIPIAPPLAGSDWVTGSEDRLILLVLHGLQGPVTVNGKLYKEPDVQPLMPGFKDNPELTDERLAALLTYIRNSWTNKAAPIDPSRVTNLRKSSMDRKEPFTEEDFN
jgi:glucose/arabinose dehydrogenase/mono/diheme cytochrome c family protein